MNADKAVVDRLEDISYRLLLISDTLKCLGTLNQEDKMISYVSGAAELTGKVVFDVWNELEETVRDMKQKQD
ncbi:MAG: hypothetical protein LBN30_00205 [Oscillospiraceae bacterium]|jgi:hypothetical protein|nr:hypothetical protein [Oscillospiraceae bacterium]